MNSLRQLIVLGLMTAVCLSNAARAGFLTEADPNWKEGDYVLPSPPKESSLQAFFVSAASPNRFLIDEDSLVVGADGVVRYVMVVRTPGGAENVTFEGLRCATAERRIYAVGRSGGAWSKARSDAWRPIADNGYDRAPAALVKDYFCDGSVPPRDKDEVLTKLRGKYRKPMHAIQ